MSRIGFAADDALLALYPSMMECYGADAENRTRFIGMETQGATNTPRPRISAGYIHPAARWIGDLRTQVSMIYGGTTLNRTVIYS